METERTKLYHLTPSTLIFLKTSNFSRLSIDYFTISKIISPYKFQRIFDYVFEKCWQLNYSIKHVGSYLTSTNRNRLFLNRIYKLISVKLNKTILFIIFNNLIDKLNFFIIYLNFIIQLLFITYYISYHTQRLKYFICTNVNVNTTKNNNDDDKFVKNKSFLKQSIHQSNEIQPVKFLSLPCFTTTNGLSKNNSNKSNHVHRVNVRHCLTWMIIISFVCSLKPIEANDHVHDSLKLPNEYNLIHLLQSLSTIGKQINFNILTKSEQNTWNYLLEKILKSQINLVKNNTALDLTPSMTIVKKSSILKEFSKNNPKHTTTTTTTTTTIQKPSKAELIAKTPSYMFKLHERHMNDWHSFGRYESNHLLHPDYVKYLSDNQISVDHHKQQQSEKTHHHHHRHHLGMITAIRHHKHIETQDYESSESNLHPLYRSKRHTEEESLDLNSSKTTHHHTIKQHKLVFQLADIPSNEKLIAASIRIRYEAKMYATNYTIPTESTSSSCINNVTIVDSKVNSSSFYWPLSLWLHSDQQQQQQQQNNYSNVDIQTAAIFEPDNMQCILQKTRNNSSSIMILPNGWFHIPLSQPVLHLIEQINQQQTDANKQIVIQIRSVVRKNSSTSDDFDVTDMDSHEFEQSNYLKMNNLNQNNENSLDSTYWLHNAPHLFTYHRDPNLVEYLKRKPRSINSVNSQQTHQNDQTHSTNLKPLNNNISNRKIAKRYKRLQRLLNTQLKQQQKQNELNQQTIQFNKQNYIKQRSRRLAQYQRRHNRASQDRYYYSDLDSTNEMTDDQDLNEDVATHRKIKTNSYDNNRNHHHHQSQHQQHQQQQQQHQYDITRSYHSNTLQTNNRHYLDTTCQRRELIINFDAVGWAGWVIAPQAYNARYCLGQCPFPLSTHYNTTNHAVLLQLVHLLDVASISGPCCVPHQLSSQSLLYHSQNGDVVLRVYEDMVVESCACR
ncbi:unnamed protein product [Schistosoma turkestanicum]|nr:unnamed protein product [Schistosoma turkestanicum]